MEAGCGIIASSGFYTDLGAKPLREVRFYTDRIRPAPWAEQREINL